VSADRTERDRAPALHPQRAWFGFLAGPFAALLELLAVYVATANIDDEKGRVVLHLIAAGCFAIAAWGWLTAWLVWRDLGRRWADPQDEGFAAGVRMVASMAILSGPLFLLLVLAQWVAIVVLDVHPRAS
jgi:hypothetical protein